MTLYQYCKKYIEYSEYKNKSEISNWFNFAKITLKEDSYFESKLTKELIGSHKKFLEICQEYVAKINYIKEKIK